MAVIATTTTNGTHSSTVEEPVTAEQLDAIITRVDSNKKEFASLGIPLRVQLLQEIRDRLLDQPLAVADAAVKPKGLEGNESARNSQFLGGTLVVLSTIDSLLQSFNTLAKVGRVPQLPSTTRPNGQTALTVFPTSTWQKYTNFLALSGLSAEVYVKAGHAGTQGGEYTAGRVKHNGKTAAVLAAGNVPFLALVDALNLAFVEGCVVVMKYHPLQRPYALLADAMLEPLKMRGYYCGVLLDLELTRSLVYHPAINHVHLTGGSATHDIIAWGPPPEQQQRKQKNDPMLKVPFTSELGCVTPWLVVPGVWKEEEVLHHARQLVAAVSDNASCNCLAAKVVFVAKEWVECDNFIDTFKKEMSSCPLWPAWYPGIRDRYKAFTSHYPQSVIVHAPPEKGKNDLGEPLPWAINIMDALPQNPKEEYAFQVEPFAPVVTIVKVAVGPGEDATQLPVKYLEQIVPLVNESVWGTLSCTIIVHPDTHKQHQAAVERALDDLQYGSVCVNSWSVTGYLPWAGYWGAFAGDQTLSDPQSGLGHVNNYHLIDHPQKAVVRTPFTGSSHPMPLHLSPLPLLPAKIIVSMVYGTLRGWIRMLFFN